MVARRHFSWSVWLPSPGELGKEVYQSMRKQGEALWGLVQVVEQFSTGQLKDSVGRTEGKKGKTRKVRGTEAGEAVD